MRFCNCFASKKDDPEDMPSGENFLTCSITLGSNVDPDSFPGAGAEYALPSDIKPKSVPPHPLLQEKDRMVTCLEADWNLPLTASKRDSIGYSPCEEVIIYEPEPDGEDDCEPIRHMQRFVTCDMGDYEETCDREGDEDEKKKDAEAKGTLTSSESSKGGKEVEVSEVVTVTRAKEQASAKEPHLATTPTMADLPHAGSGA